jgi:hypothetical protein
LRVRRMRQQRPEQGPRRSLVSWISCCSPVSRRGLRVGDSTFPLVHTLVPRRKIRSRFSFAFGNVSFYA